MLVHYSTFLVENERLFVKLVKNNIYLDNKYHY